MKAHTYRTANQKHADNRKRKLRKSPIKYPCADCGLRWGQGGKTSFCRQCAKARGDTRDTKQREAERISRRRDREAALVAESERVEAQPRTYRLVTVMGKEYEVVWP